MSGDFWQPSASLSTLRERAQFLHDIRAFFANAGVIEVDTPLLCDGVATDPCLQAFAVPYTEGLHTKARYLQTSPEFSMKRLIASGSGPIYYLGKAFRKGEVGARHNPEFTMLEWYRPGWDHFELIKEVDALFQYLLGSKPATVITYQALFEQYLGIQPHLASLTQLQCIAQEHDWIDTEAVPQLDKDGWLDLLLTHGIEPHLGLTSPTVVIDFPASQASLSKIRYIEGASPFGVAERFEFYYRGMELVNGYHELTCAQEQQHRFEVDLQKRKALGLCNLPMDHYLLAALRAGFPSCAGVALGVDRLLMLKLNQTHIAKVLPFAWEYA